MPLLSISFANVIVGPRDDVLEDGEVGEVFVDDLL